MDDYLIRRNTVISVRVLRVIKRRADTTGPRMKFVRYLIILILGLILGHRRHRLQVWGFEEIQGERRYARHMRFVEKPGGNVAYARLVYDFCESDPLWNYGGENLTDDSFGSVPIFSARRTIGHCPSIQLKGRYDSSCRAVSSPSGRIVKCARGARSPLPLIT
jgi:hypothetical protein